MPAEVQIDAGAVRRALHDRGIPVDQPWRATIRGGPSGSALRRALNGKCIALSAAQQLARLPHVDLQTITRRS